MLICNITKHTVRMSTLLLLLLLLLGTRVTTAGSLVGCHAHRFCPNGRMCGIEKSCVGCGGCLPGTDAPDSVNGLCPARCTSLPHTATTLQHNRSETFHWVQFGEPRTATTLQFQIVCLGMFLRLHEGSDHGMLDDADCHYEGADFKDGTAAVVKTHHLPTPARWSPDKVLIWHTGRHGVNQLEKMKRDGFKVAFVADITDIAKHGHLIVHEYQSALGLDGGQMGQLGEYLRYWDILRVCCGGQMSIDWRNVLQQTPGYQFKHDPHSGLAANCQMYDIAAVERLLLKTTLYSTIATYKKRYRFLPREYDGGYCERFNERLKNEKKPEKQKTAVDNGATKAMGSRKTSKPTAVAAVVPKPILQAGIHWLQLGEKGELSAFQFQLLCFAMVLRLRDEAPELLNALTCVEEQHGLSPFAADRPTVAQSTRTSTPRDQTSWGRNVRIFRTSTSRDGNKTSKGGARTMGAKDMMRHGHYIGYTYQEELGLTDAQLEVLTEFMRYWAILQPCCASKQRTFTSPQTHSWRYPACEMYVLRHVTVLLRQSILFETVAKLPRHLNLHTMLLPC